MKHDPLRDLSPATKAFAVCVILVLMVVFGLAIAFNFFLDAGPLTEFLRVLALIGFLGFMIWGQLWFARATKDAADWRGGPLSRTLESTRATLGQQRKRQPGQSESSDDGP